MNKETTAYFIEIQNKQWLADKAKAIDRSASWLLNEMLTKARKQDEASNPR